MSLIIMDLAPKFQETNSLNLGLDGIQQDGSMGPTELVKDSLFRLDTMNHALCATEEVFLSPQISQDLDHVQPFAKPKSGWTRYIRMDFGLSNHEAHSNNVELGKCSFVNQKLNIRDKGMVVGYSPKRSKCSIDWSLPNNA